MGLNIRNAIKENLDSSDKNNLRETIVEAIEDGREKMLPGLGVLFEIIWQQSSESDKTNMVNLLEKGV
jgi:small acid-soluble spore protein I (minor)